MQGINVGWEVAYVPKYVRNLLFIESIKFGLMLCKLPEYFEGVAAQPGYS